MSNVKEHQAGFRALRELIDQSGYGAWVKDDVVHKMVKAVLDAAEEVRD
jgi:hypothetical protein